MFIMQYIKNNKIISFLLLLFVSHVYLIRGVRYIRVHFAEIPFATKIGFAILILALFVYGIIKIKQNYQPGWAKKLFRINRAVVILIIAHVFFIKIFHTLRIYYPETPLYGILALVLLLFVAAIALFIKVKPQLSELTIKKLKRRNMALSIMIVVATILFFTKEL